MYEEEYELWLDKDLYFTDFIEQHESEVSNADSN